MKRLLNTALAGVVALTGVLALSAAPASANTPGLARLAQRDVDAGAPGVIVRVDRGDGAPIEIVRQAPWTLADHRLAAGDEIRMGSNSKTMVATVILQLVAEHRIALSDPVERWLPGRIPGGAAITVRMLLNHTSGLFNYVNDPAVLLAFTGQDTRRWTPEELIAAAVRYPPLFAPGSEYSYSNTNYIALGLIAQRATGRTLGTLIEERIAQPLHLTHTSLGTRAPRSLAHGYEPDAEHLAPLLPPGVPAGTAFAGPARGEYVDTTWVNDSTEWAAGGIISTAAEWQRFQSALLSGRLLPPAQLAQMRTTVVEDPAAPDGNRYGLGLERVVTPCGVVWGHDGQVPGYSTENYTDDTGRRTVAIFSATIFGLSAADHALVNGAICAMLGRPVPAA